MTSATRRSSWSAGAPNRPCRGAWAGPGSSDVADPFAVNPIRRSAGLVAVSSSLVFGPSLLGRDVAATTMLAVGWLAVTGLVMGIPILALSLGEEAWRRLRRRLYPTVDTLDLSPRLTHILLRHGYESIAAVDRAPDAALLLLSNMDPRGLREVRRAISLWQYLRWQERGFR